MRREGLLSLVACGALLVGHGAEGALISPDTATDNGVGAVPATNAIDGTATPYYTGDPGGFPSDYFDHGDDPVLTFGFNSAVEIDAIAYWGYNPAVPHPNGATAATFGFYLGGSLIESVNATFAVDLTTVQQDFDLQDDLGLSTNSIVVDQIVMTVTDNGFDPANASSGGDRAGVAEVAFNEIPEPASFALLGLGGLAVLSRRK